MTDTKSDRAKVENFLTKLFVRVGEKSAPSVGVTIPPEDLRQIASEQARHFMRTYR